MTKRTAAKSLKAVATLMPLVCVMGCGPKPPAMPYMTVGIYNDGCGYDYNGAATDLKNAFVATKQWNRGHEAALLFRFDPVPQRCVDQAFSVLKSAGFFHVWIITTNKPRPDEPSIMP